MVGSASIRLNIHHDIEIDKKSHYIQIEQSPNFPYTENLWTIESVFTKGLRRSYFTGLDTALCVFGATFLNIICRSHLDIDFNSAWSHCVGRHLSQRLAWAGGVTILHYSISGRLSWFQIFVWPPLSFNHRLWKNFFTDLMPGCLTWCFLWPPQL